MIERPLSQTIKESLTPGEHIFEIEDVNIRESAKEKDGVSETFSYLSLDLVETALQQSFKNFVSVPIDLNGSTLQTNSKLYRLLANLGAIEDGTPVTADHLNGLVGTKFRGKLFNTTSDKGTFLRLNLESIRTFA